VYIINAEANYNGRAV